MSLWLNSSVTRVQHEHVIRKRQLMFSAMWLARMFNILHLLQWSILQSSSPHQMSFQNSQCIYQDVRANQESCHEHHDGFTKRDTGHHGTRRVKAVWPARHLKNPIQKEKSSITTMPPPASNN